MPKTLHLPSDGQGPSTTSPNLLTLSVVDSHDTNHKILVDSNYNNYRAYSLLGRGTDALNATSNSPELAGLRSVMKIYWPNIGQMHEGMILRDALKSVPEAEIRLPCAIGSFDPYQTTTFGEQLGCYHNSKGRSRASRIALFEYLEPITNLKAEAFLTAWVQCARCHYLRWQAGIHHRALSVRNLMVRTEDNKNLALSVTGISRLS